MKSGVTKAAPVQRTVQRKEKPRDGQWLLFLTHPRNT
ncbi:rCG63339 [Rattus norvegicus]|uniref:RCG63339 n=1 Tax=Rattus norvegicus TaxID=10116 RepID=A6J6Z0_RAT|nr:rCG63339 [Rattus norvegicus]